MEQFCIYCGRQKATTKDHVPPKSFFTKPRPAKLITVPCCKVCNRTYGKDDERVRNLITSIDTTENHPAIQQQIAEKRDRSYTRKEGQSNFQHIIESVRIVERHSSGGIYLGKAPAFDLNQKVMDRFNELPRSKLRGIKPPNPETVVVRTALARQFGGVDHSVSGGGTPCKP